MTGNNIFVIWYLDTFYHLKLIISYIILDVIYLIYFRCRLWTMYNLNYAPTTWGVQSWRENICGGTWTKKGEYHSLIWLKWGSFYVCFCTRYKVRYVLSATLCISLHKALFRSVHSSVSRAIKLKPFFPPVISVIG